MKYENSGFTLIESIIVIVLLGFAMLAFSTFLAPQSALSGQVNYSNRASALGQSIMTDLLSRDYGSVSSGTPIELGNTYANFDVDLVVTNDTPTASMQKFTLTIAASNNPPITLVAYKGEY
ncbi:Prepilin-type N-terminal cleavage/methylation domain-containing protein [Vibrio chagasii]|nr:Prepilin-type N-terminal cleavage/methylation domain-containing protein [Vibrio chagasii]CAH7170064.1 Prepilin-type N-terminal cleavage/methylation domain-containing protein [Vibrio chagasii]CAH7186335.1 Prepilin-type N-terminal cleavage/methylation domain-containing protein [Vibrio chagasii]CAH7234996.1 Prepilin-type N-terminal cleavage/methylation domain-containing protein [Vibrio chagasii]CAH7408967.1 Prepilin-type N-terminal cleavage/methylation domain-containing protein [Vibrio chagasii